MSHILAFISTLDPLAVLFLGGSLALLGGLLWLLLDDVDLGNPPSDAERGPTSSAAAPPPAPPSPDHPSGPTAPSRQRPAA